MRRSYKLASEEPEQKKFDLPSEGEQFMQVVDVYDMNSAPGRMKLDPDTVCVKLEVAIGPELGRTLLQRLSLDDTFKGFFATRMFLKAIGEPYKGDIDIDTDRWIGREVYVNVKHVEYNGNTYANVDGYNYEKSDALATAGAGTVTKPEEIAWQE